MPPDSASVDSGVLDGGGSLSSADSGAIMGTILRDYAALERASLPPPQKSHGPDVPRLAKSWPLAPSCPVLGGETRARIFSAHPDDVVLLATGACVPRSDQGAAWLAVLHDGRVIGVQTSGARIDLVGALGERDFVVLSGGGTFTGVTVQTAVAVESSPEGALVVRDLGTVFEDSSGAQPLGIEPRTTWQILMQPPNARSVSDLVLVKRSADSK